MRITWMSWKGVAGYLATTGLGCTWRRRLMGVGLGVVLLVPVQGCAPPPRSAPPISPTPSPTQETLELKAYAGDVGLEDSDKVYSGELAGESLTFIVSSPYPVDCGQLDHQVPVSPNVLITRDDPRCVDSFRSTRKMFFYDVSPGLSGGESILFSVSLDGLQQNLTLWVAHSQPRVIPYVVLDVSAPVTERGDLALAKSLALTELRVAQTDQLARQESGALAVVGLDETGTGLPDCENLHQMLVKPRPRTRVVTEARDQLERLGNMGGYTVPIYRALKKAVGEILGVSASLEQSTIVLLLWNFAACPDPVRSLLAFIDNLNEELDRWGQEHGLVGAPRIEFVWIGVKLSDKDREDLQKVSEQLGEQESFSSIACVLPDEVYEELKEFVREEGGGQGIPVGERLDEELGHSTLRQWCVASWEDEK